MSSDNPKDRTALERALLQAQQALADEPGARTPAPTPARPVDHARAEALRRARTEASKVLEQFPQGSPARVTRTFAHVLDDLIGIPGTRIRFGVDPLLSLIPGVGTTVAALFGTVVLVDSVRLRAPVSVLARMVGNYVIDWLFGLIPLIGALLDTAWRSNAKNLKLLNRTITDREQVRKSSVTYWLCVVGLSLLVLGVIVAVPIGLLLWLGSLLPGG